MKFLVIDNGLGMEHANRLAQEGNKVWYYVPWQSAHPNYVHYAIGTGFPIEKVMDYGPYIDQADVIVFTDIGFGGIADFLRQKGYKVFGAGRGEALEQDRVAAIKILQGAGLKVPRSFVLNGVDELLQFMQQNNRPVFVKINIFRGDTETLFFKDLEDAKILTQGIVWKFGPFAKKFTFLAQEPVEGVMVGTDSFFDGSSFSTPRFFGLELGEGLPAALNKVTDQDPLFEPMFKKLAPVLGSMGYRGAFSMEAMYDGKDMNFIDVTARFPFSQSLMYCEFLRNYVDVIYGTATGSCPRLDFEAPYQGYITVHADTAVDSGGPPLWVPTRVQEGARVRFRRVVKENGVIYAVPRYDGDAGIAVVMGAGDSPQDVSRKVKDGLGKVDVNGGSSPNGIFETSGREQIEALVQKGVWF